MAKSRKNSSVIKTITKTTDKVLPAVDKGLKTVGATAKNVATSSIPVIEKGVSVVYGTMATGLDLGVKGVKTVARGVKRSRKGGRSRARHMTGGRKSRRYRSRRRY